MPRQSREKGEHGIYHIIQRGNERKNIFISDYDKQKFLDILAKMKEKYNYTIYGFCIMDNHVHLLINDNGNDISKLMKSINISYAYYFNKVHKRVGHVFQDRFKSELIKDENYLLQVSKYIHLNPVKAFVVKTAEDYKWSSYRCYLEESEEQKELVNVDKLLGILSNSKNLAIKEYITLMGVKDEEFEFMDIEDEKIIDKETEKNIITNITEANEWLNGIAKELTTNKQLRNEKIKELRKKSILSLKEIGEVFGGLSESRVSRIINK